MFATILKWTKKNKSWLVALSAIVVFCTTYVLILPAITLEQDEAAKQGGIDVPAAEMDVDADQAEADGLSFEGEGYQVNVAADAKAGLPSDTQVAAQEITSEDADYEAWSDEALKAIQDQEGADQIGGLKFAKFYNITLASDGTEIEPSAPVDVTITYDKALKVNDADHIRIVHLVADKKGNLEPQVLDPSDVQLAIKGNKMSAAAFPAESFSVYAIVYTVDFHYEMNGETFDYSMEGDGSILLSELLAALSIDISIDDIADVTFTDPELIRISQKGNDWTLKSLKAFDTEETLTVTMKNGDQFTVQVTDAQEIEDSEATTINANKSYLICYEANGHYYLLKNDGSVDSTHTPADFENLNSTYCWSFNHIFKENDVQTHLDKNYYLIRPIDNKSKTIALNNETSEGNPLVQQGNNNTAVIQTEGGFILEGYHNIGTEENHRYIKLGFNGSDFVGVDGNGVTVHIYEMDTLPTYDYTVRSADENWGTVTVSDGTEQTVHHQGAADTHYYAATSNDTKMNDGTITATPVHHENSELNWWQTGFGENKWEFDHWEQDGLPLDRNQYPATIQANTLPIPFNGSNLVAYFKQNPDYVVPDSEKEPTTVEDMSRWLNELEERDIPLDESTTKKTAEVYDYENRIYRVDLTTKANFQTFGGSLDLAFCMDVSNSMKFPSKLEKAPTNYNNNTNPIPIYQINDSYNNRRWLSTSRGYDNPYYLIADEAGTATVFKIYYKEGNWRAIDASRTGEFEQDNNGNWHQRYFIIGDNWETAWAGNTQYPFNSGDSNNSRYIIYDAGDNGLDRFHYLQESFKGGSGELDTIAELLKVAGDASPDVRIAYNTFSGSLGSFWKDFDSAEELNIAFRQTAGGGTRPDYAFQDFENTNKYHWSADADNRYVVLITDGAPQSSGLPQIDAAKAAAAHIKETLGVKIITVGLSMEDVEIGKQFLYDIADSDSNGNKMFYLAESGSDLQGIIRKVTKAIMEDVIVYGDITDEVGDAFYLVDKNTGMPLKPNDKLDLEGCLTEDENQVAGVVQADGKTIKWNNQAIDHTTGWHGTVYVKAKEDLLGGNAIQTNKNDASFVATKYRAGGNDVFFDTSSVKEHLHLEVTKPSPLVNVNELVFPKTQSEWTVYLGTEVDPEKQLKQFYEVILVEQVVNEDDSLHYVLAPNSISDDRGDDPSQIDGTPATFPLAPVILEHMISEGGEACEKYLTTDAGNNIVLNWDVFLKDILAGDVTVPYHPYGITGEDSNIVISLVKNKTFADSDTIPEHITDEVGEGVETYTLSVKFNPDYVHVLPAGQGGTMNVDMHTGTYGTMYQGHAAGRETSTNTHLINVYNVPLDVYKTDENNDPLAGAAFKLYKEDEENGVVVAGLDSSKKYTEVATATSGNDGIARLKNNGEDFGLVLGEKYYLIESSAPANYTKVNTVWEVEAQTEIGKFTDLDGKTIYSEINPDPDAEPPVTAGTGVTDDMYPFNWDQGARIMLDGEQPLIVIAKGEGEHSTTTITNGSFVSHKRAISFRHTVLNVGGKIDINVNKTWENENNPPESITVKLYRVSERNHEWGEGKIVPSTCTQNGVEEYTCSKCEAKDTRVISATDHTQGEAHRENEHEATCTEAGGYDTVIRCTVCNAIISSEHVPVPVKDHTWVNQEVEPSDSRDCYDTADVCSVCGAIDENSRVPHEHNWGDWAVTTPAQPGVAGEETRVCKRDSSHTETRSIEPLPSEHTVSIYFRYTGNGSGGTDFPGQIREITSRSGTGAGDMTITWAWDQWTTEQPFDVDGLVGGAYETHSWTRRQNDYQNDGRGGRETLTIHNITSNLTIYVTIRNGGWTGTNAGLIDQPTFSGIAGRNAMSASGLRAFSSFQSSPSAQALSGDPTQYSDEAAQNGEITQPKKGAPTRGGEGGVKSAGSMTAEELQEYLNGLKAKNEATCAENGNHTYKELVNTYTVEKSDGWSLNVEDLPKYNEYGEAYTYYVVETDPSSGYEVTYTGQGIEAGVSDGGSVTIVNTSKEYEVIIVKTDVGNTDTKLGGAKFDLYAEDDVNPDGTIKDGATRINTEDLVTASSGDDKGKVSLGTLAAGTYYLFETEAPAGYDQMDEPVKIVVSANNISLLQDGVERTGAIEQDKAELMVTNSAGVELPHTGGSGTTWIYLLGSLLLIGCGTLLIARRRIQIKD